jgi:hypothetical protein
VVLLLLLVALSAPAVLAVVLHVTSLPLHAVAFVALAVVFATAGAGLGEGCGGGVVST